MSRVNVGISPKLLSDQHLVAESVEITMITGNLRMHNYKLKSPTPLKFSLGKGHMNFFKDKIIYLAQRLAAVNSEMRERGFKPGTHINVEEFPKELQNMWHPDSVDSLQVRMRVVERLKYPKNGKSGEEYHRYNRVTLGEGLSEFCNNILDSDIYYV